MSTNRKRTTWTAAGRAASAPPADPGYGTEDQDHPAHQADPAYEDYKKGDPDAWAETPNPPPYPEGNPPAVPGYDTEDQDHPAHEKNPRVPKEAAGLRAQVERKAAKCLYIATKLLGKTASSDALDNQTLELMDMPDRYIEATLKRLGGGFLADEMLLEDPLLEDPAPMACGDASPSMDEMFSMMRAMQADLKALKQGGTKVGDQNDPNGPTLKPTGSTEEQLRSEAEATAKGEEKSAAVDVVASMFDASDKDKDGFVLASEWKGSKAVFAAIDSDKDGIVARSEFLAAFKQAEDEEKDDAEKSDKEAFGAYAELTQDEMAMLHALQAKAAKAKAAKKGEDEEEVVEEEVAGKKAEDESEDDEKKAAKRLAELRKQHGKKGEDGDLPPFLKKDDDKKEDEGKESGKKKAEDEKPEEDEGKESGKKAEDESDKDESDKEAKKAEDEDEPEGDESEDESDKEAASFFSNDGDPMGLGGDVVITAEDEKLLGEIFNTTASQVPGQEKEAGDELDQILNPQPKQASTGVKTIGQMARTASNAVDDLSQLWDRDPDVSPAFR